MLWFDCHIWYPWTSCFLNNQRSSMCWIFEEICLFVGQEEGCCFRKYITPYLWNDIGAKGDIWPLRYWKIFRKIAATHISWKTSETKRLWKYVWPRVEVVAALSERRQVSRSSSQSLATSGQATTHPWESSQAQARQRREYTSQPSPTQGAEKQGKQKSA